MTKASVNSARLWQDIEALAGLTEPDRPWTRRSFTPMFARGRAWLAQAFAEAELVVSTDAGGNLIGRRPGTDPTARPIVLGSHSDTVPSGGRFDGILGVASALECARMLNDAGIRLTHPLEVVDFLAEEPSEFGLSCVGSRAWAGMLDASMLTMTREDGVTLGQALREVGGDPEHLGRPLRKPGPIHAYLEVHIEQARALENAGLAIGAVSGIVSIRRQIVTLRGRSDHAGATPMELRHDALVAAADLITSVSMQARAASGAALVATIGKLDVHPNAANAVPGRVSLIIEARCEDEEKLAQFLEADLTPVFDRLHQSGIHIERQELSRASATACDPALIAAICRAAEPHVGRVPVMPSGAGHDGVFVSHAGPIGMIFLRCRDGLSHSPEEWAEPEDCALATQVMLDTVLLSDQT